MTSSPIQAPAWRDGTNAAATRVATVSRSPTHHGSERAIPAPARIQAGSFARPSWANQSNQAWIPTIGSVPRATPATAAAPIAAARQLRATR